MNYQKKTIIQLKEICKKRKIKGYSKLNKSEIIQLLLNNKKGGANLDESKPIILDASTYLGEINYFFYQKYYSKNYTLYDKLQKYFNNLFKPSLRVINQVNYFDADELNKLTHFERYFLFLEENYFLFSNKNKNYSNNKEYFKVIYQKTEKNHERNMSRRFKETSNNIKIIKLQNNLKYINEMIEYFNKNTSKSKTGSCMTGIRLRIDKTLKNEYNGYNSTEFNDEQFCIPNDNPYIQKIYINKKNKKTYQIGSEYKK